MYNECTTAYLARLKQFSWVISRMFYCLRNKITFSLRSFCANRSCGRNTCTQIINILRMLYHVPNSQPSREGFALFLQNCPLVMQYKACTQSFNHYFTFLSLYFYHHYNGIQSLFQSVFLFQSCNFFYLLISNHTQQYIIIKSKQHKSPIAH